MPAWSALPLSLGAARALITASDLDARMDVDGDGLGGPATVSACAAPDGFVGNADDCDDGDASVTGPECFELRSGRSRRRRALGLDLLGGGSAHRTGGVIGGRRGLPHLRPQRHRRSELLRSERRRSGDAASGQLNDCSRPEVRRHRRRLERARAGPTNQRDRRRANAIPASPSTSAPVGAPFDVAHPQPASSKAPPSWAFWPPSPVSGVPVSAPPEVSSASQL